MVLKLRADGAGVPIFAHPLGIAAILGNGRSTYSLRRGEEVWFIPISTKPALVLRQNDAASSSKAIPRRKPPTGDFSQGDRGAVHVCRPRKLPEPEIEEKAIAIETLSKFSTYSFYCTSFGVVFLLCISYIVNKPATTTITIAVK